MNGKDSQHQSLNQNNSQAPSQRQSRRRPPPASIRRNSTQAERDIAAATQRRPTYALPQRLSQQRLNNAIDSSRTATTERQAFERATALMSPDIEEIISQTQPQQQQQDLAAAAAAALIAAGMVGGP